MPHRSPISPRQLRDPARAPAPSPRQPTLAPRPKSRHTPERFADDPTRNRTPEGLRFFRFLATPGERRALEFRTEVRTDCFAGKGVAIFRRSDVETFVQNVRAFAAGKADRASIQGGAWDEAGCLTQVLAGVHIYHPPNGRTPVAMRVVIASGGSDDLLTTTVWTESLHVAQFADALAALTDGARDVAEVRGS